MYAENSPSLLEEWGKKELDSRRGLIANPWEYKLCLLLHLPMAANSLVQAVEEEGKETEKVYVCTYSTFHDEE